MVTHLVSLKTYKIQNNLLVANTKYLISAGGSTIHSSLNKYDVRSIAINYKRKGYKIKQEELESLLVHLKQ